MLNSGRRVCVGCIPAQSTCAVCRRLTEDDLSSVLDLRPFMQRTPFVVRLRPCHQRGD
jgi:hypothetical protein